MPDTFEILKARIGDWIGADALRLPESVRGDCLNFIQRQVMRNHDLRFGETTDTLALVTGDRDYALPSTWRNPLSLWYTNPTTNSRVNLIRISKDEFDVRFPDPTAQGNPGHYAIWAQTLYVGPAPDQALTLNRNYYQFLPDLANGAPANTNTFVAEAPDVLFFGALAHASKYLLEDPRSPMWEAKFMELESDLASEHQREKSSGRVPQSRMPG